MQQFFNQKKILHCTYIIENFGARILIRLLQTTGRSRYSGLLSHLISWGCATIELKCLLWQNTPPTCLPATTLVRATLIHDRQILRTLSSIFLRYTLSMRIDDSTSQTINLGNLSIYGLRSPSSPRQCSLFLQEEGTAASTRHACHRPVSHSSAI